MVFKVKDFSSINLSEDPSEDTSPAGVLLRSIMGEDLANNIFGSGGEGEGMASNGNITLNGDNIALSVAQTIVSMGIENEDDDGNIVYKPIEIIGIEVSD